MTEKTALWDELGRTDPRHTKTFKRAGGFSGTAIKPMWSFRRMTEYFGPCGQGWGVNEPTFQVVHGENKEVLVYCTVSIWWRDPTALGEPREVYGVGGDKVVTHIKANEQYKRPERWESDDEAFKKAYTDAIGNALKLIGVGADVHMGMFDDSKYVNEMKAEFSEAQTEKRQNPHVTRPEDIVPAVQYDEHGEIIDNIPAGEGSGKKLRVVDMRPVFEALQKAMHMTGSVTELEEWGKNNKDTVADLKSDWAAILRGLYTEHMAELRKQASGDDMRMAG
jgi:hypothetical protein